jgi:hypothetical protein
VEGAIQARVNLRNKIIFARNQAETAKILTKRMQERFKIKNEILKKRKQKYSR